jgi:putative restriction endonuclease
MNRATTTLTRAAPDEPLLFKLHHPENYIAGGGFFVRFVRLSWSFVWDAFGQKNGAATQDEMRRRIQKYRRAPVGPNDPIGCILLRTPSSSTSPCGSRLRRTSR